jgi:hypothetical protein
MCLANEDGVTGQCSRETVRDSCGLDYFDSVGTLIPGICL